MILPRTESKDILDSGSKSQRANEEQREICCLLTRGVQEAFCLDGPAGFYIDKELVLISLSAMEFATVSWPREGHFF